MEIKINLVEVAAELADDMIRNPLETAGYTKEQIDDRILTETEGVLHYKEDYQEEFEAWYELFYSKIENLKLNE